MESYNTTVHKGLDLLSLRLVCLSDLLSMLFLVHSSVCTLGTVSLATKLAIVLDVKGCARLDTGSFMLLTSGNVKLRACVRACM